ncbi:MAG: hypothetical protein OHK0056_23130 [Bacteriovoracaceae bacterium]
MERSQVGLYGESLQNSKNIVLNIELQNCSFDNCGKQVFSQKLMTNWTVTEVEKSIRSPANVQSELELKNDLSEVLFFISQIASADGFPWFLLHEVNSTGAPIANGFWPQLDQTIAIIRGYLTRKNIKSFEKISFSKEITQTQEWNNFLNLMLRLKSMPMISKKVQWHISGRHNGVVQFLAVESKSKANIYQILEEENELSDNRSPAQNDKGVTGN